MAPVYFATLIITDVEDGTTAFSPDNTIFGTEQEAFQGLVKQLPQTLEDMVGEFETFKYYLPGGEDFESWQTYLEVHPITTQNQLCQFCTMIGFERSWTLDHHIFELEENK